VSVDSISGTVYVADTDNQLIRRSELVLPLMLSSET
jgi:hypothetical protein